MTDSRVSQGVLQVLTLPVPAAQVSQGVEQVLVRPVPAAQVSQGVTQVLTVPVPVARISQGVLQVLTSAVASVHYVRTAGSAHPVQMKQPDGSWWPVKAM